MGWAHDGAAAYIIRFAIGLALDDTHRLAAPHAMRRSRLPQCCFPIPRRQHILTQTVRKHRDEPILSAADLPAAGLEQHASHFRPAGPRICAFS